MSEKFLVTFYSSEEAQQIRGSGCELLAEYPNSLLVRCTEAQQTALEQAGLEVTALEPPIVQGVGASFVFSDALEADVAAPITPDPNRTAYYLVELIGPAKREWLDEIERLGGVVHGNLPGFTLLIGILPTNLSVLEAQPWVEAITPYRPTMKVSPKLRPDVGRTLRVADLQSLELGSNDAEAQEQVEISVFPGESTTAVAEQIQATGGVVISESDRAVTAIVPPAAIAAIANDQAVQAILPHTFPKLFNDRAREVMGTPTDHIFGSVTLRGTGQIVAVADSGLDTGDPVTIHPDVHGRIATIKSWPTNAAFAPYTNDPPQNDDGSADLYSAHGTHVTGSVLGNGAAARTTGSTTLPQGVAPDAQVYFQAIEQKVNWKTATQLMSSGLRPFTRPWPPDAASLWGLPDNIGDLFQTAYDGGARIHTNSWGAAVAGQYTEDARAVDQFQWEHRDMLIFFAAGNEGIDGNTNATIDEDSISAPGTAKNCVTVGASENNRPRGSTPVPGIDANWSDLRWPTLTAAAHVSDNVEGMAAFSSRGPTDDQRLKPDVVAPGTNVLSMRSTVFTGSRILWGDLATGDPLRGKYCWSGGTSMSTPLVAGAAALIRQYLIEQRGHFQAGVKPSGALIKALLVNGAVPMVGQFPGEIPAGRNNVTGFGRVNVMNTIAPLGLSTLFVDEPNEAVETGQIRTYDVQAVNLSQPLKVTLVWTDAPSPVGIGGLQNQLYLQLRHPDGTVTDGDGTPLPTVRNNVQQVIVPAPVAGIYQVRVRGVAVTQQSPGASAGTNPRQDFAIALANATQELPLPTATFRIGKIFSVPARMRLGFTILGAQILKSDNTPASSADAIEVKMVLSQDDRTAYFDYPVFNQAGQFFFSRLWRLQMLSFKPGKAKLTVQVQFQGAIVVEGSNLVTL